MGWPFGGQGSGIRHQVFALLLRGQLFCARTLLGLAAKKILAQGFGQLFLSFGGVCAHETLALIAGLR
jgi:hypothetical protein